MKHLTTICLALSLALTGCNMIQPGAAKPDTHPAGHSLKAGPEVITLKVGVYEYNPAQVPALAALLTEKGPRPTFTMLSTSLEHVIAEQTRSGKIHLIQEMNAQTTSAQVVPFAVQHYNVKRTLEGQTVNEENQYLNSIAMAITPFHTPGAAKIILAVDMTQSEGKNTIGFAQRLSLAVGQKVLFMTPVGPDRMRLMVVTPTVNPA
ncbi:hypothetical protein [Pantoea cypripedii]|uniref:Lipoprotein n=1 Tax=Pantoea cypripedii TaxID=55209 RepID=A0A1X1EMT4_PANCY|nr:hypothetical protein [Pantoea cypripedii]MBP2199314.1 putative small secreted protein [Pantoea cypripedii]ORM90186.1 hypothetical protein HA50_26960 [Pantoea cypripedii]